VNESDYQLLAKGFRHAYQTVVKKDGQSRSIFNSILIDTINVLMKDDPAFNEDVFWEDVFVGKKTRITRKRGKTAYD